MGDRNTERNRSTPSDAELIVEAGRGSDAAFTELYRRHATDVLAYFLRRTGDAQTSADLTSETFAAALASRRRFRDTGAPGRAWLFKIAERQLGRYIRTERVADRARRRAGMPRLELDPEDIERVERLVDFAPLASELRQAVAALPAGQAEALRLRLGDGLAYAEVADRLGCSEGAARVRVSRGLSTLALGLGEYGAIGGNP